MTENAAEAVKAIAEGSGLEPEPGLRIAPGEPTPEGTPLEIGVAGEAQPQDQTVETNGARIYLDPPAAQVLDDKELDASIDGDQVRFTIGEQAPAQ
jgi:Fe-S cluster assembly iron-binding protein IscA